MSKSIAFRLAKKALEDEILATSIYGRLAERHRGEPLGSKFDEISKMEARHVEFWRGFLKKRGHMVPAQISTSRVTGYSFMLAMLGRGLTLKIMEMNEGDAVEMYSGIIEANIADQRETDELKRILEDELVHEQEFAREESRFEGFLTYVKDAVLGMNDGLVEILSITTGLAGVYGSSLQVALGGLIVGIAGALSMGISTYASARAQRQVHEGILRRILKASMYAGNVFRDRIASRMIEKGYSKEISASIADESTGDQEKLSSFIAEEEHGLRKEALVNPFKAGLYAGSFNAFGALLPLLPYFLGLPIGITVLVSVAFAGLALAVTGALIAILANLHIKSKVVEMLIAGLGSAAATYLIGRAASIILGVGSH